MTASQDNPVEKIRQHAHVLLDRALETMTEYWTDHFEDTTDNDGEPLPIPDVNWIQVDLRCDDDGDERCVSDASDYVVDIQVPPLQTFANSTTVTSNGTTVAIPTAASSTGVNEALRLL